MNMPDEDKGAQPVTVAHLQEAIGHVLRTVGIEFSQLREEMNRRFDAIDRRFEAVDRRLDRISDSSVATQQQTAALARWADRLDRDNNELHSTQAAQQKTIDDL